MRIILPLFCAVTGMASGKIVEETVSHLPDETPVKTFTITNESGITATVSNLGATLRSLSTPDREGKSANILVGCKSEEEWLRNGSFFGSTVGRFANRIAGGRFTLDGTTYDLAKNNGPNHLHGGVRGFDKVIWESEITGEDTVKFSYLSKDGEEGYPGNLSVTVEYSLRGQSLVWQATATTDKATPVNITNHAYFNLTGDPSTSVTDHLLSIPAESYLPVDRTNIPLENSAVVSGTPFDFTAVKPIARNLRDMEGSYDHNYVHDPEAEIHASLHDPVSGRSMILLSNQPGLQFYLASPHGNRHSALCLEPQKFPDSPNRPDFPSSILRPGETYSHHIELAFVKPAPSP